MFLWKDVHLPICTVHLLCAGTVDLRSLEVTWISVQTYSSQTVYSLNGMCDTNMYPRCEMVCSDWFLQLIYCVHRRTHWMLHLNYCMSVQLNYLGSFTCYVNHRYKLSLKWHRCLHERVQLLCTWVHRLHLLNDTFDWFYKSTAQLFVLMDTQAEHSLNAMCRHPFCVHRLYMCRM